MQRAQKRAERGVSWKALVEESREKRTGRVERERLARGRAGEAHVEKDVCEERTWLERHTC